MLFVDLGSSDEAPALAGSISPQWELRHLGAPIQHWYLREIRPGAPSHWMSGANSHNFDAFPHAWHSTSSILNDKIKIVTQWTPLSIFRLDFWVRQPILPVETHCDQWSSQSKDPLWANLSVPDMS